MKNLLIILSLLPTSVSWSKDADHNNLVERDGLLYEKLTNVPFTGKSVGIRQGKIKNGKREGEWFLYFGDGNLLSNYNYKDGKKDGEWLEYHENGQLKIKRNYKDGKLEGESLWYHKNGQLESRGNFKDDEKEGEWSHYRSNGKLWRKYYYKDVKKMVNGLGMIHMVT